MKILLIILSMVPLYAEANPCLDFSGHWVNMQGKGTWSFTLDQRGCESIKWGTRGLEYEFGVPHVSSKPRSTHFSAVEWNKEMTQIVRITNGADRHFANNTVTANSIETLSMSPDGKSIIQKVESFTNAFRDGQLMWPSHLNVRTRVFYRK